MSVWYLGLGGGFVALGYSLTLRITPEHKRPIMKRWLYAWTGKGLLLPLLLWSLMNVGLSAALQPFLPEVQAARNSGLPWFPEWLRVIGLGFTILSSYWAALTLFWVLVTSEPGLGAQQRKDLRALAFTCSVGLGLPSLLILLIGGWPLAGVAATVVLGPLAAYAPSIIQPAKLPPMYARAIARMKFGKYSEAEWEIIRELERCEDDFEGWMMLAELYATRFTDIKEAERTVLEICAQPRTTPSELAIALHRLSDWHLKVAEDPVAARKALQMLIDKLPGSHLAKMAQLRMNQIPTTVEKFRSEQTPKTIPLPALRDTLHAPSTEEEPKMPRAQAASLANSYSELLKNDPNDTATRERLARLFSTHLERPDLGFEQLRLLLNMPNQDDARRAEWLSLSAAWTIKYKDDSETGRRLLQRVIDEFPTTPQAFAARRQLTLLDRKSVQPARQTRGPTLRL